MHYSHRVHNLKMATSSMTNIRQLSHSITRTASLVIFLDVASWKVAVYFKFSRWLVVLPVEKAIGEIVLFCLSVIKIELMDRYSDTWCVLQMEKVL